MYTIGSWYCCWIVKKGKQESVKRVTSLPKTGGVLPRILTFMDLSALGSLNGESEE